MKRATPQLAPLPLRRDLAFWFVAASSIAVAGLLFWLASKRFETFHNETFDLALYGRMAWGMVRGDFWEPITNANVFGVHIMPILFPLGVLAEAFGSVRTLLGVQALCLAGTAIPLFWITRRELGSLAGVAVAFLWWAYPHIFHVASFEFHPGNIGVLLLVSALAVDPGAPGWKPSRAWWLLLLGAVACREDIALSVAAIVLMRSPGSRARWVAIAFVAYFMLFSLVAVPLLGPTRNSVVLHFGHWGQSAPEIALYLLSHPIELLAYLFSEERSVYLCKLVGCLSFLPLLGLRWLIPASPFLAMNLMSAWPSAIELDSHYQTLILPFLFLASIRGLARLRSASPALATLSLSVSLLVAVVAHRSWGGSWLATDFDSESFAADSRSQQAKKILERVPDGSSVQAPYPLMSHLLRRPWIASAPPPDRDFDHVALDLSSREAHRGDDTILRTDEEPFFRAWLGRTDYGVIASAPPFVLLERGASARAWATEAGYLMAEESAGNTGQRLASCLRVLDANLEGTKLAVRLAADGPCDKDLAIRLGDTYRPERVELLFDGLLNPAQLHAGDVLRSEHTLSFDERRGIADTGLCIGAVRRSGVRPEKSDPVSVCVAVRATP